MFFVSLSLSITTDCLDDGSRCVCLNVVVPNQAMRTSLTLKTAAARYYITGSYSLAARQYTEALDVLYDIKHRRQEEEQVDIYIVYVCMWWSLTWVVGYEYS